MQAIAAISQCNKKFEASEKSDEGTLFDPRFRACVWLNFLPMTSVESNFSLHIPLFMNSIRPQDPENYPDGPMLR